MQAARRSAAVSELRTGRGGSSLWLAPFFGQLRFWPNANKFRNSECTIIFLEKKHASKDGAKFLSFFIFPPHLAVFFLTDMQQECTILQQCVQSTYTQPADALQACMQGTHMCS